MNSAEIITTRIKGEKVLFYCPYPDDHIIKFHLSGEFYEAMELGILEHLILPQSEILDVGTNVGNHLLFYAAFLNPKSITWVEPNPVSIAVLEKNLQLNDISKKTKVIGHPGIAFSNKTGSGTIDFYPKNMGGAKVSDQQDGTVRIVKGDEYLKGKKYDFIKLDTEVQDIEALEGIESLIQSCQPIILVEIYDSRKEEFDALLDRINYKIQFVTKRYRLNTNYLITAKK